jgi:hypothetical protein
MSKAIGATEYSLTGNPILKLIVYSPPLIKAVAVWPSCTGMLISEKEKWDRFGKLSRCLNNPLGEDFPAS